MIKKGIFFIIFGIVCFIIIIAIDFVSGKPVFKEVIQAPSIFQDNKLGPVYLISKNNYGVSISVNFKGRLDTEFKIQLLDEKNNSVWISNGYIKGELQEENGNSIVSIPPFRTSLDGNHYILFKLLPNKYDCEIRNLSINLKKNVICTPSSFLIVSELAVVLGFVILLKEIKKNKRK